MSVFSTRTAHKLLLSTPSTPTGGSCPFTAIYQRLAYQRAVPLVVSVFSKVNSAFDSQVLKPLACAAGQRASSSSLLPSGTAETTR